MNTESTRKETVGTSVKVYEGTFFDSDIDPTEDVITTRFTFGLKPTSAGVP